MAETIRGITYNFGGPELTPVQAAQRLYLAGFKDAKDLCIAWAVMESESGGYLRAWNHNVVRDDNGDIHRTADGNFLIKSTDLGFIQRNVVHSSLVEMPFDSEKSQAFVDKLFEEHPMLARGDESAEIAHNLFVRRGFSPWYAYLNKSYKRNLERACLAVGNYLAMVYVGDKNLLERRSK